MITYKSKDYDPKKRYRRYVRCDAANNFFFCEVDDKGYDVAQGIAYKNEIKPEIASKAKVAGGMWPSYVEWPY